MSSRFVRPLTAQGVVAVVITGFFLQFLIFDFVWALDTTFSGFQFPIAWLSKLFLSTLLTLPLLWIRRRWYVAATSVAIDLWLIANLMYFRTYYTVIPLSSYALAGNLSDFQASVWESLRLSDLIFPAITAAVTAMLSATDLRVTLRHIPRRLRLWLAGFIAIPMTVVLIHTAWKGSYREAYEDLMYDYPTCGAAVYTIPGTWAYEFLSGASELTPDQRATIEKWLGERATALPFAIEARDNCIIILCESLESWVLETTVDGIEITPNLNRLLQTDNLLYAPKVLSQVMGARSIDAQLILHTGMLPVAYGAYSSRFPHNTYMSLDKAFKEKWPGAKSMTFTVDKRTVWNVGIVAQDFGYDILLDKPNFLLDVPTGPRGRLGDDSFLRQSAEKIASDELWPDGGHTLLQCVTYSGHTPFVIPDELKQVEFDERYPERIRNYMTVANYTDRAIGEFLALLKKNPKFDNTMIVITGDHEGVGVDRGKFMTDEATARFLSPDQFVPFIVVNSPVTMRYEGVMGQIDLYPTLLDLMGLSGYGWRGLGQSILDPSKEPYAVSPRMEVSGVQPSSAAALEHSRSAYAISDMMICSDWFATEEVR